MVEALKLKHAPTTAEPDTKVPKTGEKVGGTLAATDKAIAAAALVRQGMQSEVQFFSSESTFKSPNCVWLGRMPLSFISGFDAFRNPAFPCRSVLVLSRIGLEKRIKDSFVNEIVAT